MALLTKMATGDKLVLAYSMTGLFLGYLYFSIPRVITTVMATAEKIDLSLEEAARSLGASTWRVVRDVLIPALMPGLISSGAICFATSMGAFGTAFTLATDIDVLAHRDLYRVYAFGQYCHGIGAVDHAGADYLGGAIPGAQRSGRAPWRPLDRCPVRKWSFLSLIVVLRGFFGCGVPVYASPKTLVPALIRIPESSFLNRTASLRLPDYL